MLVLIANREEPDQTASSSLLLQKKKQYDMGLCCLSMPFLQATSVQNFRTFTIGNFLMLLLSSADFFKTKIFKTFFQEHYQSVKWF